MKADVLVIGAGAVGTAITRELTKYRLKVICVDKREDVGGDCSKSNSAIIHTGYDAKPGSLESELVVSGVRSTGLTNSISVGHYVANLLREIGLKMEFNENFIEKRKGIVCMRELSREEQHKKILENPLYGNIVCRCERVTEGEIVDAIHSPIPAKSVDAIKRRLRAGMGRCQGGFCGPKDKLFDCMAEIRKLDLKAPVNRGDVLIADVCGTGVDIVASGEVK